MARQKKDSKPVSIRMNIAIYDKLEMFCENSGQPKTVAIERAVEAYINSYEERLKKQPNISSH